jgi:hypothetical protein
VFSSVDAAGYLVGAIVTGLASQAGTAVFWLCVCTAALLAAAVLTPFTGGGSRAPPCLGRWPRTGRSRRA